MELSTKIKQTIATMGLAGLLTANSGCLTAGGVVVVPVAGVVAGGIKAYDVHPLLTPLGLSAGVILSPVSAIVGGVGGFVLDIQIGIYVKDRLSGKDPRPEDKRYPGEGDLAYYYRRLTQLLDE